MNGYRATKFAIEVFGVEAPKTGGRILEKGEWMNQALVNSERIDEGLERRSGRAAGANAVDLPLNHGIVVVCRPEHDADRHGSDINDQYGSVPDALLAATIDVRLYLAFHQSLELKVQCGDQFTDPRVIENHGLREMRRQKGEVTSLLRD